ncbi:MAG: RNA 2',3'-cyclic phosphodiesterase [Phycisphaerales bacterium]|nr:RNA 2',3'-cyclic phosphodiesterase [Phycisphaerales bacterium]
MRLFAAAYPPPEAVRAWLGALAPLGLPPHRATPAEQVHLTLQFIGETDARELDDVSESVARAASGMGAITLTPRRIVTFPLAGGGRRPTPPRLVALETDAPGTLVELHRRLAHRLARHVRRPERERFVPHFTLARFAPGERAAPVDAAADFPPFEIGEVRLMRSTLSPGGATHHVVAAYGLA